MQDFKVIGVGSSAVIVRDAMMLPNHVFKVYLTEFSEWSYQQETRSNDTFQDKRGRLSLLKVLKDADPDEQFFYIPDNSVSTEIRDHILSTQVLSEMYGRFMQLSFRKGNITDETWSQFRLLPKQSIKILRLTYGLQIAEEDWSWKFNRQAQECLRILHKLKIAHNDVHLWNFVLSPMDSRVRLIDFGEAEYVDTKSAMDEDISNLDAINFNC